MIWNVPGHKGGRRSKALTQGSDYLPTLIELTGGKARPELPGRSLEADLRGNRRSCRAHDFHVGVVWRIVARSGREE